MAVQRRNDSFGRPNWIVQDGVSSNCPFHGYCTIDDPDKIPQTFHINDELNKYSVIRKDYQYV
jgi:hypothetical protein